MAVAALQAARAAPGDGLGPFFFAYKIFLLAGEPAVHNGRKYNFTAPYLEFFLTFIKDAKVLDKRPHWGARGAFA